MAKTRVQKQKIIEDLKGKIAKQKAMIFVDFTGLKVKDLSALRKRLKTVDSELKIAKKTLLNIVLKGEKIAMEPKKLAGEIAAIFGYKEATAPVKTIWQFSKENPDLKILAGFFEGEVKSAEDIIALAQLPSRDELLAKLVGSISAPILNFVMVLEGNIKGLIYVLAKAKT